MSIIFFSLQFIKEKKKIHFFISIFFAALFHNSAIVAAPLYFLFLKRKKKLERVYLYYTLFGIILSLFFFEFVTKIFSYDSYLFGKYSNAKLDQQYSSVISLTQRILLVLPLFLWRKKLIVIDSFNRFYFNVLFIYIFIQIFTLKVSMAIRLGFYFEIVIIPILINVIKDTKFNAKKINILFYIFIYLMYKFIYIYNGSGDTIPYSLFQFR
jgi:hypothetical protein